MSKLWTNEEVIFLKENYKEKTYEEIASLLGRTKSSIERKLSNLGLSKKDISDYTFWTDEKISFLKENKDIYSCKELGIKLGFTEKKILKKLSDLGLKKLRITDVPRKKKVKSHDIHCELCHSGLKNLKGLEIHIVKKHPEIDLKEYFLDNIGEEKLCFFCGETGKFLSLMNGFRNLCDNEICLKKSFSSHSIEGIMYRENCDLEEAEKIFKEQSEKMLVQRKITNDQLRSEDPLWDKKRSRNCPEFWINKGFSEEDSKEKAKEVMSEIHEKTFKKFKENPEKYVSKYPTKIEYYLERGYSEEVAKKKLIERQQTFSLKKCIQKHGESDGQRIWQERQEKWKKTLDSKSEDEKIEINRKKLFNNSGYSKVSQLLFWRIYDHFQDNNIKFEELNSEIIRYDKKRRKHYKYDYVDFTLKKCIEFNGDYWHCNPDKYNESFIHPIMKITAKEIWEKDNSKNNWLENRGYKILTIWESEWRKFPDDTLDKCLKFLSE